MIHGIKLKKKGAQKIIDILKEAQAINYSYFPIKEKDHILVAVILENTPDSLKKQIKKFEFKEKKKSLSFKESLTKKLTKEELSFLKTAYDIVGSIAIIEIDSFLEHKKETIAKELLSSNPSIKTVVRKKGAHEGELRIQQYEHLAGVETITTIHKENNCALKIVLDQVYYSARSATERKRICEKVKPNETVLVMFSGCGPFVCTIAKNTLAKEVIGIELNSVGHELLLENCNLNKLKNVTAVNGDVRDICEYFAEKNITFDRILMPLPKTANEFLKDAFKVSKKGTIIHLYDFVDERKFPDETIAKIDSEAKNQHIKYTVLDSVLCGQFSPYIHRVCVDFKIEKKA